MPWMNADGLYIKYGTEEATVGKAGTYTEQEGGRYIVEFRIPALTALTTGDVIQEDNVYIPKGARIEYVEVMNTTAATSGGSATLNIGLIRSDRTTAIAATGLVSAAPLTDYDTLGETKRYSVGVTGAGSLVGTVLTNPGLISAKYATAAFTAGALTIRIAYSFP